MFWAQTSNPFSFALCKSFYANVRTWFLSCISNESGERNAQENEVHVSVVIISQLFFCYFLQGLSSVVVRIWDAHFTFKECIPLPVSSINAYLLQHQQHF